MSEPRRERPSRTSLARRPASARSDERVVAVTGASAFLGAELIRRLEADWRVARVLAIDLRKPAFPLTKTQFHKVDLTQPATDADLAGIFRREGVDTVVHAAFLSSPTHDTTLAHELESIGTMHVHGAVAESGARKLVQLSTTLVYGAHPLHPNFLTEEHERRGHPRSRFVSDKLDAERQAERFARENPDVVVTILRAAATLGPTIRNFATRFFERPVCPLLMGYDPLLQVVHEEDVVEALALAVDGDHPGAFNVVGDGVLPYTTVLALLGRIPLPMPAFVAYPVSRALWMTRVFDSPPSFLDFLRYLCVCDGAKARRELGFRPQHDIKATLQDFLGVAAAGKRAAPAGWAATAMAAGGGGDGDGDAEMRARS